MVRIAPPVSHTSRSSSTSGKAGAETAPRDAVKQAAADQKITKAEWKHILPQLETEGPESKAVRELLDLYTDRGVSFDAEATRSASALLQRHGYGVVDDRTIQNLSVKQLVEGNAAAHDVAFERLSTLVGDTKTKIAIAVVDGGFAAHPTLMDNVASGRPTAKARYGAALGKSFGRFTADAKMEGAVHGTHVAGIATAGTGRIQAALHAVPLATAAELTAGGSEASSGPALPKVAPEKQPLFKAIEEAAKKGARVVNVSIETFVSRDEAAAYRSMFEKYPSTLFVFGAGNDQFELGSAPGEEQSLVESFKLPNLAVVGASYPDGGRWGRSNFGESFVDLAARGHHIASADGDGEGFRIESGTSMASPNVTNLAAKMLMLDPTLPPAAVVGFMAATSDVHHSWKQGAKSGGTVHPERAMAAAAARTLVRGGASLEEALQKVGVTGADALRLKDVLVALG